jgi:hypothetical protein
MNCGIEFIPQTISSQKSFRKKTQTKISSFYQLAQLMNKKSEPIFYKILYHVLIGNQVVIRSNDITVCDDIAHLFMV